MTPVITFDQPLFWKALLIVESEPSWSDLKKVVLRLGGLHTEMSFLGCVGHLMAGSGLEQVLEVVYAENAVKHILNGKAFARAVRGHFMVHAALKTMLTANAYNIPLPTYPDDTEDTTNEIDAITHEMPCDETSDAIENNNDDRCRSLSEARELFNSIMKNPQEAVLLESIGDSMTAVIEAVSAEKGQYEREKDRTTLASVHGNDRDFEEIHQSRENWRLGIAPSSRS